MSAPLIGRRDAPPSLPNDAPRASRRCDHCGRTTTDWMARDTDDDRGPAQVLWCRDAHSCTAARRASRSRARTWLVPPWGPRR